MPYRAKIKTAALIISTGLLGVAPSLLSSTALAAGSATLYLSPASATVTQGNSFTVNVYEDSGSTQVNAVQANLTYSTSQLSYVSYTNGSSPFTVAAQSPSGNTGELDFARGTISPVTGAQLVVSITFKAAASSGTATVSFGSGSAVAANDGNGTNILTGTTGGNYTLQAPASSGGGSSGGSGGGSSGGSGGGGSSGGSGGTSSGSSSPASSSGSSSSSASGSTAKTTTLSISNVTVGNVTDKSVTISWQTSVAASSEVDYGTTALYGMSKTDSHLTTSHSLTINSGTAILASTTYHFRVRSVDAKGNAAASKDLQFTTASASQAAAPVNKSNTAQKVGVAGGVVLVAILLILSSTWLRRHHQAKAELERHFSVAAAPKPIAPAPAKVVAAPPAQPAPAASAPQPVKPNTSPQSTAPKDNNSPPLGQIKAG